MVEVESFRNCMMGFIKNYDAIICPVHVHPALEPDDLTSKEKSPAFSHCQTYNLTGWPSVVVRAGTSLSGLPIGVQIVTRPWREDVGFAIARLIEEETGGFAPPAS